MLLLVLISLFQFYFLDIVRTSPIKETTLSCQESGVKNQSPRYSPYTVKSANIHVGSFHCPNGQIIPQSILMNSVAEICPQIAKIRQSNLDLTLVASNSDFQSYEYPIHPCGHLFQPVKDSKSEYKVRIHQDLRDLSKCSFAAVYFISGQVLLNCPFSPPPKNSIGLQYQAQSSLPAARNFNGKLMDCNGHYFHPQFIIRTLNYAQAALQKKMTKLQLSSEEDEEYPIQFVQPSFSVKNAWMFPLLADGISLYIQGDPGPYFLIMKNDGGILGAVYRKNTIQIMKEAALRISSKMGMSTSEFRSCKAKK